MAKRLIHRSPKTSEIEDFTLGAPTDDEVLVRTIASGISLGTEKKVALGQIPESVWDLMRVPYMNGQFDFPVGYGYSLVGEVIEGNNEWLGKRVFLMHPHQDFCRVNKSDLMLIPEGISDRKATLIANMETALNGFWDGEIKPDESILIIGFGLIGALISGVLKSKLPNPIRVLEKDSDRRKTAASMGLKTIADVDFSAYDVVYNTAGNSASIELAFKALKLEGRLIEMSWHGTQPVCLDLGSDFHIKRLKIISSQVSHIPKRMEKRWDFLSRRKKVLELLRNSWFDQLPLKAVGFDEAPRFFDQLRKNNCPGLGYFFSY